jgi:hypothetical protein
MKSRVNKKPAKEQKKRSETFFLVMTLLIFLILGNFFILVFRNHLTYQRNQ